MKRMVIPETCELCNLFAKPCNTYTRKASDFYTLLITLYKTITIKVSFYPWKSGPRISPLPVDPFPYLWPPRQIWGGFFLQPSILSSSSISYHIYEWCNLFQWLYNNYTLKATDLYPYHLKIITMPLLTILIVFVVVGVILWLINNYVPMDRKIKNILNVVAVIVVVIWLLQVFGVLGSLKNLRV